MGGWEADSKEGGKREGMGSSFALKSQELEITGFRCYHGAA